MFIRKTRAAAGVTLLALAFCLGLWAQEKAETGDTKRSSLRDWKADRDTPPQRFRSEFLEKHYLNK